jgi:hypothetical protein
MRKFCFSKNLFKLCRILSNEIDVKFKLCKHLSSKFKFIKVLRQADAIAPLLFHAGLQIAVGSSKV